MKEIGRKYMTKKEKWENVFRLLQTARRKDEKREYPVKGSGTYVLQNFRITGPNYYLILK